MQTAFGYFCSLQKDEKFEGLLGRQRVFAENTLQRVLHGRLTRIDPPRDGEVPMSPLELTQH